MSFFKSLCLGLAGSLLFFSLLIFGLTLTARSTVLNPQFLVNESEKLDIDTAARELLADQTLVDETYTTALNRSIEELEPWIKRQISQIIYSSYDYLQGKNRNFKITLNIDPLKTSLIDNLTQVYLESPPPEYMALSRSKQESYLADIRQDTLDILPSTLEIDESVLGEDVMSVFKQAKAAAAFFDTAFLWSLVIVVLLIILMIIILRKVKEILRSLGVILILDGALTLLALVVFQNTYLSEVYPHDLIPELQVWISAVIKDLLAPGWVFGLVLLISGILFLAGSFFWRRRLKTGI
jgi:hypothetical protein